MTSDAQAPAGGATSPRSGLPTPEDAVGRGPAAGVLDEPHFVNVVRWVFTARLVCLALASPAVFASRDAGWPSVLALTGLTVTSLLFGRSPGAIRRVLRHPILASLDVALSVLLLVTSAVGQPAALAAVCSALAVGLLFPRRQLALLMVPLSLGALTSPTLLAPSAPDGLLEWLSVLAGLPVLLAGVCVIGTVIRYTFVSVLAARRDAAEAMAAVAAAEERARLARDMHDSVGKSLHGISLGARALSRAVEHRPALVQELATSLAEASEIASGEARSLLMTLRTGQVDRPTVEVVNEELQRWSAASGVEVELSTVRAVDASAEVTAQMRTALREVLHNVEQHARASRVQVSLEGGADEIVLEVVDDGRGFDLADVPERERAGHFGLRGVRERAEQLGGTATISSQPGGGTTVRWTARRHG
ncbi:sensor histidine kinase [Desertihabitans aurantiacus]|uniref:sensor histidine kinase n=1 Tax=Desertihabitans aurantiacus TaxID=2282477 RepID=UPI000DF7DF09|nr:ATP-binding protein [Desertihabitans aurantiacus]